MSESGAGPLGPAPNSVADVPGRPFLTARWEHLVLLNYACPRALLDPLVPAGTTLDGWDGHTLVSLVGFLFADTRVLGCAIPFHRTFEEVNLRFYVRRTAPDGTGRRGVVFIRELVPRRAIALVARWIYHEPYSAVRMSHAHALTREAGGGVEYAWRARGARFAVRARVHGPPAPLASGSEGEFVTEHYWGYTRMRDGGTNEYRVEHPRWDIWSAPEVHFDGPAGQLYGREFGEVLSAAPRSAFVAVGSEVAVRPGRRIE